MLTQHDHACVWCAEIVGQLKLFLSKRDIQVIVPAQDLKEHCYAHLAIRVYTHAKLASEPDKVVVDLWVVVMELQEASVNANLLRLRQDWREL